MHHWAELRSLSRADPQVDDRTRHVWEVLCRGLTVFDKGARDSSAVEHHSRSLPTSPSASFPGPHHMRTAETPVWDAVCTTVQRSHSKGDQVWLPHHRVPSSDGPSMEGTVQGPRECKAARRLPESLMRVCVYFQKVQEVGSNPFLNFLRARS